MQSPIYSELAPVRRRQQGTFAIRAAVLGMLAGSIVGGILGLTRWLSGWPPAPTVAALALAAGPVLGLLIGLLWRRSWHDAAAAVDRHYGLKDRATTALAFLTKADATALHELEIHEGGRHSPS